MSTEIVFKLFVETTSGEEIQVGPDYSTFFPFLFESSLGKAKRHYERLGLKTRVEESTMEFDNR